MTGDFTAFYLQENEYNNIRALNKRFEATYTPYLLIRVLNNFSENSFEGLICQHNKFFDRTTAITKNNSSTSSIVTDYFESASVYSRLTGYGFFE